MLEPEPNATLILNASISPSEDPKRVISAMQKVVGSSPSHVSSDGKSAKLVTRDPKALERVRDQFRDRRIRSSVRRQFLVNKSGRSTTLMLNRQAAAAGVVAICGSPEESSLGPIYLTVESDDLDNLVEWFSSYSERLPTSTERPSEAAKVAGNTRRASLTNKATLE